MSDFISPQSNSASLSAISFAQLIANIRACAICKDYLPLGPRPIFQVDTRARILIAGQAPGAKVHESGIPFDDASGDRLRNWMGVTREQFYDTANIAILGMGFCYPGRGKSGDMPPRPECAPKWRHELLAALPNIELTLVIGQYAMAYHLSSERTQLTEVVRDWENHWPRTIVLPHPSPRNNIWLAKNEWFERDVVPKLKLRTAEVLGNHYA